MLVALRAVALAAALASVACVSQPQVPAAAPSVASAPEIRPAVYASAYRMPSAAAGVVAALPAPLPIEEPRPAAIVAKVDVTVLSRSPIGPSTFLLEPEPPLYPRVAASASGSGAKADAPSATARPAPAALKPAPPAALAAGSAPEAGKAPSTKPSAAAKPAAVTGSPAAPPAKAAPDKGPPSAAKTEPRSATPSPEAKGAEASAAPAEPLPALWPELPAAPPSSAPSVDPANPAIETKVGVTQGERLELRFPGSGWIYLGDEEGKEGVKYGTRRYEGGEVIFALDPASPGEYLLKFQRQNPVDGLSDVSFVRLSVGKRPAFDSPAGTTSTAVATGPLSSSLAPATASRPGSASAQAGQTVPGAQAIEEAVGEASPAPSAAPTATATASAPGARAASAGPAPGSAASPPSAGSRSAVPASPSGAGIPTGAGASPPSAAAPAGAATAASAAAIPAAPAGAALASAAGAAPIAQPSAAQVELPADPAALVSFAKAELAAKRPINAILALDKASGAGAAADDELAFLYGSAYEAESPERDVRRAYGYYRKVRDEYPRSLRWKEAADRVAYLERHFLGLR